MSDCALKIFGKVFFKNLKFILPLVSIPLSLNADSKITANDKGLGDFFGSGISKSGSIVAIASYEADPDGITDSGAVYLYQIETNGSVTFLNQVTAFDKAAGDLFGHSISLSQNILAVGSRDADPGGITNAGAVYLYQIEDNGSTTFLSKVTAPDKAADDLFGYSVSITDNFLAIGAYGEDPDNLLSAGAVYLYVMESNGSAVYKTKLTALNKAAGDFFGYSIHLNGNLLAVGAHGSDPDGVSAAGVAFLYEIESNGSASFLSKVMAPDKASNDNFGISVFQDNGILSVGSFKADLNSNTDAGAVYLFEIESNGSTSYLSKVISPESASFDYFGLKVSQSGSNFAIASYMADPDGLNGAGAVYLYKKENDGTIAFLSEISAPDKAELDHFGSSVLLNGNDLVVGATYADPEGINNAGAAYLFDISSYTNSPPINLTTIDVLYISENQPIGTAVGEFNATDPDGDPITYALVSGVGDGNNSLFTLETNGTLKSATVFDYENNASNYAVRVQAKDDSNASVEGNFTISLLDGPNGTIALNFMSGGSVTGGGTYDQGTEVAISATPSLGYLFNGWSGDLVSSDENETITVSDDYNITATFAQDTGDTDDDGLSNYYELAILGTNPESADTDGDGFSDLDENATGLDPTVANTALYDFQADRENTARSEGNATGYQAGLAEGNASGIAWVQQNLSAYSLVSEADKNATDLSNYLGGISDGNISGINFVRNYPATYSLFTEAEKNASDANSYNTGFTDGNTSGYALGVEDGNESGINYFRNNPGTYGLFTEKEKNASDANSYNTGFTDGNTSGYAQGVSDGNTSGIQLVVNSPSKYQLFTLAEKEVSDEQAYELGYNDGDVAGYALGLVDGNQSGVQWLQENSEQFGFYTEEQQTSTQENSQTEGVTNAQDEVSSNGLSSLTYLEYVRQVSTLYLSGWHHKEGMGWLWTDKQTFPFVFRKESESQPEGWLYFSPLPEQASAPFYDYLRKEWVGTP